MRSTTFCGSRIQNVVERRIKEEIRGRRAGKSGQDSRSDPPLCRRHHDRQHVNERNEIKWDEVVDDDEADRRQPDQRKRRAYRHGVGGGHVQPTGLTAGSPDLIAAFCLKYGQITQAASFLKT